MKQAKSRLKKTKTRFIPLLILAITAGTCIAIQPRQQQELLSPIPEGYTVQAYTAPTTPEPTTTPTPEPTPSTTLYEGKISYYSHEGCLGCHPEQLMGNGQPFDENAMTLAVPCEDVIRTKGKPARIRYNTKVTVTNEDTGKTANATITDCGGFSKYNRIADLSKGLAEELGAKTDKTTITIRKAQ